MVKVYVLVLCLMVAASSAISVATRKSVVNKQKLRSILKLKASHKGEDRFSNPSDWVGLVATWEEDNGVRCLTSIHCYPGRYCSDWGWCQGTATSIPNRNVPPWRVTPCSSQASSVRTTISQGDTAKIAKACRQYRDGCGSRVPGCPSS